jgi:hypothetical protein
VGQGVLDVIMYVPCILFMIPSSLGQALASIMSPFKDLTRNIKIKIIL